ncbi:methenyltetrahydrofolate cyclohydrolase / 5,10-methylenetetrahydrofolate dehydrogenase (NADP+) [Pyrobaculum islandicum DSM 4184]|uniref:Bifunctional protein FolD n=1 Tax=Pyrobaculum islandicum (strain DSM 4184 / JCM 9189 / GEO3) TaxID=384616 RepID=FOLD_PYRIL|nr:bifunctional 5,10-methylenetetrahydrofolate dehydrogenase/5,10-methenyltetrahydrofolate cyclohydrolase [Pyrobaculum islandicum]A1RQQ5.1 RecName: Full=Bifunctional protein FolD; Includes: RecName: Full=Methylenetetrahydrofolate dehydrogenase; Includes: RecName: Full=Methenyltetrahydrofolate cyclohydrolase [Pyrobaculum islandicum DSM 4184]ABL87287.1 methenyltetrahydrofolate cyclohydrolase / 5,10-methylenetetrahydrofolate dehydrogenase (NADP+) [Pyrobaculum islandicum DSM 4184]
MVVWIKGDRLHTETLEWARRHVKELERYGVTPKLAVLLLNDDPIELETQHKYVSLKARDIKSIGGEVELFELYKEPPEKREVAALKLIERLNNADDVTGILVQKPLPPYVDETKIFERLSPLKDVDGLTPENKKRLVTGFDLDRDILPCTPAGILELFRQYKIDVRGKDVVVVGKGTLVGFPLSIMLMQLDATVTVLHALSKDRKYYVRNADIIISAVGRPPELYSDNPWKLTGDFIKEGAVVVGVGGKVDPVTKKWYFDVDEKSVAEKASYLTPNIGGVGLATRARLVKNLIITSYMVATRVASPRLLAL